MVLFSFPTVVRPADGGAQADEVCGGLELSSGPGLSACQARKTPEETRRGEKEHLEGQIYFTWIGNWRTAARSAARTEWRGSFLDYSESQGPPVKSGQTKGQ